jgi:hypothetical protein
MLPLSTEKCSTCQHFRPTALFELCAHPTATYYSAVDGFEVSKKPQQHTVGHMRRHECSVEARLYSRERA